MRRTTLISAAALVVALTLAGCADQPAPEPATPTATPTSSATPTPTPVEPEPEEPTSPSTPDAAPGLDVSGALANIVAVNEMVATHGDAADALKFQTCPFGEFAPYLEGLDPELVGGPDLAYSVPWRDFRLDTYRIVTCSNKQTELAVAVGDDRDLTTYMLTSHAWETPSEPTELQGGAAITEAHTIRPDTGDAFEVMQFAWEKDGLVIYGRLRADAATTLSWLDAHLPRMVEEIAAWEPALQS